MKNEYIINGSVTTVYMRNRKVGVVETKIDTRDLLKLLAFGGRFHANLSPSTGTYYAIGEKRLRGKRQEIVKMHRLITSAPQHLVVDHVNGDTLDNRRCNLRLVTYVENAQNRKQRVGTKSGYRNVYWSKRNNMWRVEMTVNGKVHYIGGFRDVHEANKAAIEARKKLMPCSVRVEATL